MAFTYDPTTNRGRVRRTIPDKIEAGASLTDAEIDSYLEDFGDDWRLAAAQALDDRSGDELFVQKVQKTRGVETNGAALMTAYQARIQKLRDEAAKAADDAAGGFMAVPVVRTAAQARSYGASQAEGCDGEAR